MTPQELRAELLAQLGRPEHYDKARQWRHISLAEQEVAYTLRLPEVQATTTFALQVLQDAYDLPQDYQYNHSVILMPDGLQLKYVDISVIDRLGRKATGLPSVYGIWEQKLVLNALPQEEHITAGYEILMRYYRRIPTLNDNSSSFTVPPDTHELVLLGALYRAHYALRDYDSAEGAFRLYRSSLDRYIGYYKHQAMWERGEAINLILPEVL